MNAADRRRLTPVLGALAVVLVALLIALWSGVGRGIRWQDAKAPSKLRPIRVVTPPPVVTPLEQYAEVWLHPLFSPTRTPEPVTSHGGETHNDLELTGVILLPGLRMAILHDKASGRDYRAIEGEPSQDGPVLLELHPRSAAVEASGARLQLQLIPGASPEADGPSASVPAGPQAVTVQSAGHGVSAMVSRPGKQEATQASLSAAARARALKARIEAERRRARQHDGG